MELSKTNIEGIIIIKLQVFPDSRGTFTETYNKGGYIKTGINSEFLQDNESVSKKGVIRGLHFQVPPFAQGKLVRVIKGRVLDVAVDIRKGSPTYGQYFSIELCEENKLQLWIPEGFAHGFASLTDNTIFSYKCTNIYNKESERTILWNDKDLKINWNIENPIISEKDITNAVKFKNFISPF